MMSRKMLLFTLIFIATFSWALSTTWAFPFRVTVDISSIPVSALDNISLEFDLFDNNGTIGDSHVLIDNVVLLDGFGNKIFDPDRRFDFEGGETDLGGFDESLNPDSVSNVDAAFTAPEVADQVNGKLRIDEDPVFTPTITFWDFSRFGPRSLIAHQLRFDFEFFTPDGSTDSLVALLVSPSSGDPLLEEGVFGPGDPAFLEAISPKVNLLAPGVTVKPIPEPSTLVLIGIGVGGMLGLGWRRRKKAA